MLDINTPASADRWTCPRPTDFALRDWPDGSVLYDEANGQIHFLNPAAGIVMRLFLEKTDWSIAEIAHRLLEAAPSREDIDLVNNVLVNFLSLKLIARAPDGQD